MSTLSRALRNLAMTHVAQHLLHSQRRSSGDTAPDAAPRAAPDNDPHGIQRRTAPAGSSARPRTGSLAGPDDSATDAAAGAEPVGVLRSRDMLRSAAKSATRAFIGSAITAYEGRGDSSTGRRNFASELVGSATKDARTAFLTRLADVDNLPALLVAVGADSDLPSIGESAAAEGFTARRPDHDDEWTRTGKTGTAQEIQTPEHDMRKTGNDL